MLKLRHMSGTRTVLVENLLRNSDLPPAVSQQELPKMVFQDYAGMQLHAHSNPSRYCKTEIPLGSFHHLRPANFCLCLQCTYLPSASQP